MKDPNEAAQAMLDAMYGLEAGDGFGALSAATATAVAGYMKHWGKSAAEAEDLLAQIHEETVVRMHEVWGTVQRNDC